MTNAPSAPVSLHRRLTTLSAALFGLSYICPTVVISTFGVLAQNTRGASASHACISTRPSFAIFRLLRIFSSTVNRIEVV